MLNGVEAAYVEQGNHNNKVKLGVLSCHSSEQRISSDLHFKLVKSDCRNFSTFRFSSFSLNGLGPEL